MKTFYAKRKHLLPFVDEHNAAVSHPRAGTFEWPLVELLEGWEDYARAHQQRYESPIGDDGVLGVEWEAIGHALLGLLNGELGRLDGGTLDAAIRERLRENGFNPDEQGGR